MIFLYFKNYIKSFKHQFNIILLYILQLIVGNTFHFY